MITLGKSILIRDMNNEAGKENANKMEFTRQMSKMYNSEPLQNAKRQTCLCNFPIDNCNSVKQLFSDFLNFCISVNIIKTK